MSKPNSDGTQKSGLGSVWIVLLSLMLAFTLRELLVEITDLPFQSVRVLWLSIRIFDIEDYVWILQFVVFLLLIMRFFAGAFRFHEEAVELDNRPEFEGRAFGSVFNLIMTFLLFSLFFVGANQVFSADLIYVVIFLIHAVDTIWFLVTIYYFKFLMKLSWKEPMVYPASRFLAISLITMAVMFVLVWFPQQDPMLTLETRFDVKLAVLGFLFLIGIADFLLMKDFYIHPKKWRAELQSDYRPRVYLAGPEVFLRNQSEIGESKRAICQTFGLYGVFPIDDTVPEADSKEENAFTISEQNERKMGDCDVIVANMTPFRGPSMDVGTAYEMGYMRGRGKLVLAYSNEGEDYFSRVKKIYNSKINERDGSGEYEDQNGMLIENFGLIDNLMLDGAVRASGSRIEVHPTGKDEKFLSMDAFECCVAKAANILKKRTSS